jgi:hypothetical protein
VSSNRFRFSFQYERKRWRRVSAFAEVTPIYIREVLWAMADAGYLEAALEMIRGRYGPMLEMFDNPTIWEGWRRFIDEDTIASDEDYERFKRGELLQAKGRRSLVHGGVGPALLLSQEVLGVHRVGAGLEECRIEVPQLDSVTWARGIFRRCGETFKPSGAGKDRV